MTDNQNGDRIPFLKPKSKNEFQSPGTRNRKEVSISRHKTLKVTFNSKITIATLFALKQSSFY